MTLGRFRRREDLLRTLEYMARSDFGFAFLVEELVLLSRQSDGLMGVKGSVPLGQDFWSRLFGNSESENLNLGSSDRGRSEGSQQEVQSLSTLGSVGAVT